MVTGMRGRSYGVKGARGSITSGGDEWCEVGRVGEGAGGVMSVFLVMEREGKTVCDGTSG